MPKYHMMRHNLDSLVSCLRPSIFKTIRYGLEVWRAGSFDAPLPRHSHQGHGDGGSGQSHGSTIQLSIIQFCSLKLLNSRMMCQEKPRITMNDSMWRILLCHAFDCHNGRPCHYQFRYRVQSAFKHTVILLILGRAIVSFKPSSI
jgi:hypothetical protein